MTWAKQLKNLRTQKEALDHLANMDVEKARPAVPALIELFKDTKRPEHLEALARYLDPRTRPIMIEALDYTDDDFDRATIAAGVLGDMKDPEAVAPLIKAAEKELPVKSRANNARIAAMRALVKIGDKRAVPTLMKILTTSADDQDFLLNQKAALGLAEFRDPQSIPALIKGLFMTGRGTGIFQECRLALVRIGAPAVDPMIAAAAGEEPRHPGHGGEAEVRGAAAGRNAGRRAAQGGHPARRPARQEGGPRAGGAAAPEGARRRAPVGADRARLHRHRRRPSRRSSPISRTPRPIRPSAPRPPTRCTCRAIGARCRRCWRSRSRAT